MLTEQELNKIFSWLPYRADWPVDRDDDDTITGYYGDLISNLTKNKLFDTYYSNDSGLGNFLGFICYPPGHKEYNGNAIMVYINLCAPLAVYGQTTFQRLSNGYAYNFLKTDAVCTVTDVQLKEIENEIIEILSKYNLILIDKAFAGTPLPNEIAESLKHENHNQGNRYLHGLFQETD